MEKKHIVTPTMRKERGKCARMGESSNNPPPQGNPPPANPLDTCDSEHRNIINANEILFGRQTVDEVMDALGVT